MPVNSKKGDSLPLQGPTIGYSFEASRTYIADQQISGSKYISALQQE